MRLPRAKARDFSCASGPAEAVPFPNTLAIINSPSLARPGHFWLSHFPNLGLPAPKSGQLLILFYYMANCIRCGRQLPPILFGKKICQWCVQHEAAQRGELDEDAKQPVIAAPWVRRESSITVTQVILGANVMVFIAMVI